MPVPEIRPARSRRHIKANDDVPPEHTYAVNPAFEEFLRTVRRLWLNSLTISVVIFLTISYLLTWYMRENASPPFLDNALLFVVGLSAATIANSTGVGGGVVFLPTFEFLNHQGVLTILPAQVVAMSFIIQCFGMTTGSITWLNRIYHHNSPDTGIPVRSFFRIIGIVLLTGLPALLVTQWLVETGPPVLILFWFKAVSIVLGLVLLYTTLIAGRDSTDRLEATPGDYLVLALLGVVGGIATAFFSVGLGELVALYLFSRSFPLVTSAAIAVIIAASSVLVGVVHHLMAGPQPWELLVYIIPGAMLGGYVANRFAYWLGTKRLKILAALWIVLSSVYLILTVSP